MFALGAVEPDWLGVVDFNGEGRHHSGPLANWHETRVESSGPVSRRRILNWNAWVGKGSTDDGVIHWVELKLNEIANGGLDLIWFEDRLSVHEHSLDDTNSYRSTWSGSRLGHILSRNESGEGGNSEDSLGEKHFCEKDCLVV